MAEIRKTQLATASAANRQQGQRPWKLTTPSSGGIKLPPNNQDETNRKKLLNGNAFVAAAPNTLPKCSVPITATCPPCNFNGHTKYACHKAMASTTEPEEQLSEQMDQLGIGYIPSNFVWGINSVSYATNEPNQPTPTISL